jgi:hypothetical protein
MMALIFSSRLTLTRPVCFFPLGHFKLKNHETDCPKKLLLLVDVPFAALEERGYFVATVLLDDEAVLSGPHLPESQFFSVAGAVERVFIVTHFIEDSDKGDVERILSH